MRSQSRWIASRLLPLHSSPSCPRRLAQATHATAHHGILRPRIFLVSSDFFFVHVFWTRFLVFLDVFGMFFEILFLDVCLNVCLFFLGWGGIEKSLVSFGLILYGFVQCPNQHLRTEHLRLAMAIPALRHRSCLFPGPKEPEIDCDM